ncbi:MAG: hypothetical protein A3D92_07930 [Bacteroidetes bacterium RIFCSPHIGHO2_02_FULL_44_7]|nr:MAG: hypothetical protein A3D92_07930 [Bacteroidetes bacterium RIFCSPHIGHO2_02_FULL_44_7]
MRNYFLIFFLFFVHLTQAQSFTKLSNTSECKAKIEKRAQATYAITANFSETVHSAMYNNPKAGSGKLKYKKSNKIRWEHVSPKKQIVLINGSKVRLYENGKENKNAASSQVIKKVQALMIQLFSGEFLNEKEFNIEYYESSQEYKLILKPKSSRMSKYISKVEMYFSKKELTLNKMILMESTDERIVYGFSNIVINGQISESSFTQF